MEYSQFHFVQGAWLWGLLAIPIVLLFYALFYEATTPSRLLERFADRQLLPHLIKHQGIPVRGIRKSLLVWALAWLCGIVAMAGPCWNYTDQQAFKVPRNFVIVLDLSQTMNAEDVRPSRVARAREEIQDLLDISRGTDIGLIAYAAVPHMVTPLTDDVATIKNLLPALDTSLVTLQGDRLRPALEMAARMLKAEPGGSNSILVISDGEFEESDFTALAHAAGDTTIYTMGIGTLAGGLVPDQSGGWLQDAMGKATISRMQENRLQQLATAGHGFYVTADYSDSDTRAILGGINAARGSAQFVPKSVRVWEDRFYVPALALVLLLLPLFKRGFVFAVIALLAWTLFPGSYAQAATVADLFLNRDQQADAAYDRGDYKGAMAKFDTDYRRGVVAYRAGAYDKAAALFQAAASKNNDLNALYNLGNAQLMQFRPEDAIASYEAVLRRRPGDASAQHNLAIAREMLAQQNQKPNQNNKSDQSRQNGGDGQSKQKGKNEQHGGQNQRSDARNQPQSANQEKSQGRQQDKPGQAQQQAGRKPTSSQGEKQDRLAREGAGHENDASASGRAGAPPNAYTPMNGHNRSVYNANRRAQLDVNADEWLNRIQSDPGSFLKNQFMMEDRESGNRR
jgi:Ca-activated chloride channel homolog